jgi:sigma-54 dependent transcriptional regulator, acetoin dehydrogenase operon transcriptional activator AcoR
MQRLVHDYESVWKQFVLHGAIQEDVLPPAVLRSWRRSAAQGLDPCGENGPAERSSPILPALSQNLLALVRPAMEDLHQFVEGSACVVVFTDAEVRIVDRFGDQQMQEELEHFGILVGASWREEERGSNALALAFQESFPMQLEGAMHYCAAFHPLYTSAAPVYDLMGHAVGVLAVIGRKENCHPHILGMIAAAAQALSNQFQMQAWSSKANELLSELKSILQTLPEGILLLRRDGVISQMNAPAGTLLGLTPAQVTGRRLRDVLPIPSVLLQAMASQQPLLDEEMVIDTGAGRITCLCSLKPLSSSRPETGLQEMVGSRSIVLSEPVAPDGFVMILRSMERVQKLVQRMIGARARLTFANAVGESPALQEALRLARLAAKSNSTVLLQGETGTGKEIFAQSIHSGSARADGPFVAINCAAIPRELINTELFGYEGGSFTGADRQGRAGKFEQAQSGTLFLDEIGDMPLDLQTTLLRDLETRTIVRIGGHRVIPVDVRIIVATHKDLPEAVRRGTFRSDLFYRLNVLTIHLPALRSRVDDMPLLIQHFLQRQSRLLGRSFTITAEALAAMQRYPWPGNVRELENMLERVSYLLPKDTITLDDLPLEFLQTPESSVHRNADQARTDRASPPETPGTKGSETLKEHSTDAEVQAILQALHASHGQITRAAALLEISRTTLWRKMLKYGLHEKDLKE